MGKRGQLEGVMGAFTSLNNPDFGMPLGLGPCTSHSDIST